MALGLSEAEAASGVALEAPEPPPLPLAPPTPAWPIVRWVHPSLSDWADAESFAPERRLATRLALPLAGACALGGFVTGFFGWPTGLLHLLALYHVVERVFPRLSLHERRVELEGPRQLVRVSVTPEAIVIDRGFHGGAPEPTTSIHRWEELSGYYPSPRALVVLLGASDPLLLPRAAFSEVEFGLLTALFQHKLGPARPARVRGLFRPLVVSVVLLVAWALWQAQL